MHAEQTCQVKRAAREDKNEKEDLAAETAAPKKRRGRAANSNPHPKKKGKKNEKDDMSACDAAPGPGGIPASASGTAVSATTANRDPVPAAAVSTVPAAAVSTEQGTAGNGGEAEIEDNKKKVRAKKPPVTEEEVKAAWKLKETGLLGLGLQLS